MQRRGRERDAVNHRARSGTSAAAAVFHRLSRANRMDFLCLGCCDGSGDPARTGDTAPDGRQMLVSPIASNPFADRGEAERSGDRVGPHDAC